MVENIAEKILNSADQLKLNPAPHNEHMLRNSLADNILRQVHFVEGLEFAMEPRTFAELSTWFFGFPSRTWLHRNDARAEGIRAAIALGLSHISEKDIREIEISSRRSPIGF